MGGSQLGTIRRPEQVFHPTAANLDTASGTRLTEVPYEDLPVLPSSSKQRLSRVHAHCQSTALMRALLRPQQFTLLRVKGVHPPRAIAHNKRTTIVRPTRSYGVILYRSRPVAL